MTEPFPHQFFKKTDTLTRTKIKGGGQVGNKTTRQADKVVTQA